jgi:hypothetical protein
MEEMTFIHVPPPKTTFGDGAWYVTEEGGFVFFNRKGEYVDTAYTYFIDIDTASRLMAVRNRVLNELHVSPPVYRPINDEDVMDKWPGGHRVDPQLFATIIDAS